jgi:hypothetical protein
MRRYFRSLLCPLAGAIAVHYLLGWKLLAYSDAAAPSAHTVLVMTLVSPVTSVRTERDPPRPHSPTGPPPNPRSVASDNVVAAPARRPAQQTEVRVGRESLSGTDVAGSGVMAQAEHFYSADELTRLPGLNGEPLIDLGEESQLLTGSVTLTLFIDEIGHVVDHRSEGSEGIPDALVEKLTRAFVGYPYVPGQRQGEAVKSQVTLIVSVREGQAAMSGTR